ncbi:MAG: DegT/DnrJ/EryC1/StrS aminotransferase family protein [Spirochaetales bacterium]|nr:DegT/DnrJ/EryC1/StrS aminotransferase family protein [Spirochaetales bacterium]
MNIPVHSSYIRRKDMDSVLNCLVSDAVGPGELGERLVKLARETLGLDSALTFRSPVDALLAALEALGMARGTRVAASALSPAWYARAFESYGVEPIWLDVAADSGLPGPSELERARERGAVALVYRAPYGLVPDPVWFAELGMPLVEDVSSSLGARFGERSAGSLGALTLIGLEQADVLTAGGGALLAASSRREGTVLKNLADRFPPELRLPDMNAALAIAQLKELERAASRRREIRELLGQALARSRHAPLVQPGDGESAAFGLPIVIGSGAKEARAYARKKDIETAGAFDASVQAAGLVPEGECPRAAALVLRCVLFPLHPKLGKNGAQKLSRVLATLP